MWNQITREKTVRQRGFAPSLSDSEVMTMEIVGEFMRIDTDKGIWSYFRGHWQKLFPQIRSRSTFVKQAANLWCYKQELQKLIAQQLAVLKHFWIKNSLKRIFSDAFTSI